MIKERSDFMAVLNPYNYAKPKGAVVSKVRQTPQINNRIVNKQTQNDSSQYLEQKVMTASPEELTLMLYEGAIKFIKQAIIFNNEGLIEKTSNAILRAQAIFSELRATLNTDYDVSVGMDQLYEYVLFRLVEANIGKDNSILDEVLEMSEDFRNTWKEAMAIAKTDSGE